LASLTEIVALRMGSVGSGNGGRGRASLGWMISLVAGKDAMELTLAMLLERTTLLSNRVLNGGSSITGEDLGVV
jgi:hypothetical protein